MLLHKKSKYQVSGGSDAARCTEALLVPPRGPGAAGGPQICVCDRAACASVCLPRPQEILVFDSKTWGRVLVLDGVIQLTTSESGRRARVRECEGLGSHLPAAPTHGASPRSAAQRRTLHSPRHPEAPPAPFPAAGGCSGLSF